MRVQAHEFSFILRQNFSEIYAFAASEVMIDWYATKNSDGFR